MSVRTVGDLIDAVREALPLVAGEYAPVEFMTTDGAEMRVTAVGLSTFGVVTVVVEPVPL